MSEREQLIRHICELAVVPGRVTLSSGKEADYYIDLRRVTLSGAVSPILGRVMNELVSDWEFDAIGGLTLGADPVATAMIHTRPGAGETNAFVVRKEAKAHGMQRRIEGPDIVGRRVLVVEDTSTTGDSVLTAVDAVTEAGGVVVGVAVVVDRQTGAAERIRSRGLEYRYAVGLAELGL